VQGFNSPHRFKIFRCTAKIKNLRAVGEDSSSIPSAAFTKIHISKEDFEKAKKGGFR